MEEATLTRDAPRTDATIKYVPAPRPTPVKVTVNPATLRALRRPPLPYAWPDGAELAY